MCAQAAPASPPGTGRPALAELCGVWERVQALARAEDAALKRLADLDMQRTHLKDVGQVRDAPYSYPSSPPPPLQ